MMFIIRTAGEAPQGVDVRLMRNTPALIGGGTRDFFCDGDPDAAKARQLNVVAVHDGWYADDTGGGVAIWGQGRFWESRDTPFSVRESSSDGGAAGGADEGEVVNVRQAIFGV